LRDIEVCLRAHESRIYHLGIRGHVARSNLTSVIRPKNRSSATTCPEMVFCKASLGSVP
jgi:hypothetical protein